MTFNTVLLGPRYRLYERRLLAEIQTHPLPHHVGIILDGNRRHGQQHGITGLGHLCKPSAEKHDEVLAWCSDFAIPTVTLWVCSTDNLARPPEQVSGILAAIQAKLGALATDPRVHARHVRVDPIGRLDLLPPSTLAAIARRSKRPKVTPTFCSGSRSATPGGGRSSTLHARSVPTGAATVLHARK